MNNKLNLFLCSVLGHGVDSPLQDGCGVSAGLCDRCGTRCREDGDGDWIAVPTTSTPATATAHRLAVGDVVHIEFERPAWWRLSALWRWWSSPHRGTFKVTSACDGMCEITVDKGVPSMSGEREHGPVT